MKQIRIIFICAIASLLLLTSCKKGDPGPAGPVLSGDLVGFCYITNSDGSIAKDNSGITVSAEGTGIVDTTSYDGHFILSRLNAGIYNISFSKPGYCLNKFPGFQFVGGGQAFLGYMSIYPPPDFTVSHITASITNDSILNIQGTLSDSSTSNRIALLFWGTSPNVSSDPKNYLFYNPLYLFNQSVSFSEQWGTNIFYDHGIVKGQTIYLVAYSVSYSSATYLDFTTGRYYFSGISTVPSNVVKIIVQ
jgi:hypothetical protein